jgi:hypothetical protein
MPAARPVQYCRYCLAILPRLALWAPGLLTLLPCAKLTAHAKVRGDVDPRTIRARACAH